MLKIMLPLVLSLFITSCGGPRYVDFFPCHDDGTVKPVVALIPVNNSPNVSCDIAAELTDAIRYQMMDHGDLYLLPQEGVETRLRRMGQTNFFGNDSLFAQHFCNADFVVITELLDHCFTSPGGTDGPCKEVLTVKMRVKIIDVREDAPCIVLQEIIAVDSPIPRNFYQISGMTAETNEDGYQLSSIERAHNALACKFVSRAEEVIRSAF